MELTSYADLAVRLVNTESPLRGRDDLTTVDDFRELVSERKRWRRAATEADVAALRKLRAELRDVFDAAARGDDRTAVAQLNRLLNDHPVHPQISGHDAYDWHLHLAEDTESVAECYAAGACMGLAVQLTAVGIDRLGVCHATPCRAVFIDTSTNRSRRYCSDRCATRANVAAFRARRKEQQAAAAAIH